MSQYGRKVEFTVHEAYSPPRVTDVATAMGLIPGMAFDLTTNDPDDGLPWDFNNPDEAEKSMRIIEGKRAILLIGSPMCTAFSSWQHIIFAKMSDDEIKQKLEYRMRHIEFAAELYRIQIKIQNKFD